jgi:hypothetical protein
MMLEDLVGEHELTGVEFGTLPKGEYDYEDANTMTFVLDGHAYCVVESPDDGYRSSMRDIFEVPIESVKNTFAPVRVLARYKERGTYSECDILELIDIVTAKVVLEAGTDNSDDYYPSYVANFTPENMASNQPQATNAIDPQAQHRES